MVCSQKKHYLDICNSDFDFSKKAHWVVGTVGETVRDNCACMIGAHADNWMVPGRELITPVGTPLEVVEDGAVKNKTEEGGST